jgi:hypothetical protein
MHTVREASGIEAWVDGNAAGGILASAFSQDATRARIICGCCGQGAAVAEQRAFALEMGAVLRCPTCAGITLRVAVTPHGVFIDARGVELVHLGAQQEQSATP